MKKSFIYFLLLNIAGLSCVEAQDIAICRVLNIFGKLSIPYNHSEYDLSDYKKSEDIRRHEASLMANNIYEFYQKGKMFPSLNQLLFKCYHEKDFIFIKSKVDEVFFSQSIDKLRHWGERAEFFVKKIEDGEQYYNVTTHDHASGFNSGYDRGLESNFNNINRYTPQDFLIAFLHEQIHRVDKTISDSVAYYRNSINVDFVVSLANTYNDPKGKNLQKLSDNERKMLQRWVLASFDKGILGEVRAWSVVLKLYLEARAEGKIALNKTFEEKFLRGQKKNYSKLVKSFYPKMVKQIYQVLEPEYPLNFEGFFSMPLIKEAIVDLSKKIHKNPQEFLRFQEPLLSITSPEK